MRYIFIVSVLLLLSSCQNKQVEGGSAQAAHITGRTMGTHYNIKVVGLNPNQVNIVKQEIDAALEDLNMQVSTYIPQSEISRFNSSKAGEKHAISGEFRAILDASVKIHSRSKGAFDATVGPVVDLWGFGKKKSRNKPPTTQQVEGLKQFVGMKKVLIEGRAISKIHDKTELDFGSIAKGYGVDLVAQLLREKGFKNFLVEIGGEVAAQGLKADGSFWLIGVEKPVVGVASAQSYQAIIKLSDIAVATSGDYRNYFVTDDILYSHTIDPVTCKPIINHVASVTVLAPTCMLADGMATAITVMGREKGLALVEQDPQLEVMIIERHVDGYKLFQSSGFAKYIQQ